MAAGGGVLAGGPDGDALLGQQLPQAVPAHAQGAGGILDAVLLLGVDGAQRVPEIGEAPVRKVFYNLTITGLSIAVAFVIGTIELIGVLHDKLDLTDAVTDWVAGLDLDNVGYVIVGLFVLVWAAALSYWRLAKVEERWTVRAAGGS